MEQKDTTPESADTGAIEVFEFPTKEAQADHYEILTLISGNATEEQATAAFEAVKTILSQAGAILSHEEALGRRALGYTVDGSRNGTYFVAEFDLDKSKVAEVNEKLRIHKEITRFLIIKKKVLSDAQIAERERVQKKIATRKAKEREATKVAVEKEKKSEDKRSAVRPDVRPAIKTDKTLSAIPSAIEGKPIVKEDTRPKTLDDIDAEIDKLLSDDIEI